MANTKNVWRDFVDDSRNFKNEKVETADSNIKFISNDVQLKEIKVLRENLDKLMDILKNHINFLRSRKKVLTADDPIFQMFKKYRQMLICRSLLYAADIAGTAWAAYDDNYLDVILNPGMIFDSGDAYDKFESISTIRDILERLFYNEERNIREVCDLYDYTPLPETKPFDDISDCKAEITRIINLITADKFFDGTNVIVAFDDVYIYMLNIIINRQKAMVSSNYASVIQFITNILLTMYDKDQDDRNVLNKRLNSKDPSYGDDDEW